MGRTTTFLVGLALLTLSACNGSADPPPPSPSPTATVTSTPAVSPPTPPAMPEAAKAHTKAGAKAFVEHFWEVVNYAQATGDTGTIRDLVDPGCEQCTAGINSINKVYAAHGIIHGGEATTRDFWVRLFDVDGTVFATVEYDISVAATRFDYDEDSKDNEDVATDGRRRARLAADPRGWWRVVQLEGLP